MEVGILVYSPYSEPKLWDSYPASVRRLVSLGLLEKDPTAKDLVRRITPKGLEVLKILMSRHTE